MLFLFASPLLASTNGITVEELSLSGGKKKTITFPSAGGFLIVAQPAELYVNYGQDCQSAGSSSCKWFKSPSDRTPLSLFGVRPGVAELYSTASSSRRFLVIYGYLDGILCTSLIAGSNLGSEELVLVPSSERICVVQTADRASFGLKARQIDVSGLEVIGYTPGRDAQIWNASTAALDVSGLTAFVLGNTGLDAYVGGWVGRPFLTSVNGNSAYDIAEVFPNAHQSVPFMIYRFDDVEIFEEGRHGSGLSLGAIVMICLVASIILVAVAVVLAYYICYRKARVEGTEDEDQSPPPESRAPIVRLPAYSPPVPPPPQQQPAYEPPPPYTQPGYAYGAPAYPGYRPGDVGKPPSGYANPPDWG
jgi:hypothetical protein